MHKHLDEANQRILEMLEASKARRQTGELSLAEKVIQSNKVKSPQLPKIPKI